MSAAPGHSQASSRRSQEGESTPMKTVRIHPRTHQSGATLVVALVMLLLLSLMAANAFKGTANSLTIVGNTQWRQESLASAQKAIEQTVSSAAFATDPELVAATPVLVDINGDGTNDYSVSLNPQPNCFRNRTIKTIELDPALPADLACVQSSTLANTGLDSDDAVSLAGNSMCAAMEWDIAAAVNDQTSNTNLTIHQGVSIRVPEAEVDKLCL